MYKYIIFSELCPTEHNPRSENATLRGMGPGDKGAGYSVRGREEFVVMGFGIGV